MYSKSNPFLYFVCLQGQTELCGSYNLLQSCFSFFVHLHRQPQPFGSCTIFQSCSSFIIRFHGQPEWPGGVSHGFLFLTILRLTLVVFWFSFLLYRFRILSSHFFSICYSVSKARFAFSIRIFVMVSHRQLPHMTPKLPFKKHVKAI